MLCACVHTHHSMPVKVRQRLAGVNSLISCVLGDQSNPGVSLGTKCFCPLNHLISSFMTPYGGVT